ncbi:MAG: ring-opening amidohydrolase [Pseudomonadota bacterium]
MADPVRMARVHRVPMSGPDDTSAIETLIRSGEADPEAIVAVIGKTEGNGCVNDFTRGYAVQSLRNLLTRFVGEAGLDKICMVMSGGTEGALSPHWIVFETVSTDQQSEGASLALAAHVTRDFQPWEIGRMAQVDTVADGVRIAMREAAITRADDVHFVQIKCPLLTAERIAAVTGGNPVATADTLRSMGLSRGASALGVAVALGELDRKTIRDEDIGTSLDLFSARASCSAGIELMGCEIVVMGMSETWSGPMCMGHTVMADALDVRPVTALLGTLGLDHGGQLDEDLRRQVAAVLVKAEASKSGHVRGARHTMLNDSDISSTRHARGFVAGVLGGVFGFTDLFVSGGAEHQGPDGGGPCAVIIRKDKV